VALPALLAQLELEQLRLVQVAPRLAPRLAARLARRLAPRLAARLARRLVQRLVLALEQLVLEQLELAQLALELWVENSAELLCWRATESQQWQEEQKIKSKAQG